MLSARMKLRSTITVIVRDTEGHVLEQVTLTNTITDLLLNLYRDALAGDITADEFEVKYLAVGDDNTPPPDPGDTTLGNETFRKPLTSSSKPGTGQYKTVTYIAPAEAEGLIEELGWFAGPAAQPWGGGAGKDTGTLIARVLYSRNKTALESIQVERTDTIVED